MLYIYHNRLCVKYGNNYASIISLIYKFTFKMRQPQSIYSQSRLYNFLIIKLLETSKFSDIIIFFLYSVIQFLSASFKFKFIKL